MQEYIDYNFLIIGRSGSGKSATSKLLTGDPSITVANSLNQVTKSVSFYQGICHPLGSQQIRFGILDIPGLDRIDNRFTLRQVILNELERLKISIHAIIYVASLTQRDTVDRNKLFQFLEQLPWKNQLKKNAVIPILTKYDNFIIDSPDEDIKKTLQQFGQIFHQKGFNQAWNKRLFWVNYTKSLEFKMKINELIREVHQNQIQKLTQIVKKNRKNALTVHGIRQYIQQQEKYILQNFFRSLHNNQIPFSIIRKAHQISLHIKLQPKKYSQSLTTMSASSIGLILSRVMKQQIPTPISMAMAVIPLSLTLINMTCKKSVHIQDKVSFKQKSDCQIMGKYSQICHKINNEVENQWIELNKLIEFFLQNEMLVCKICKKKAQQLKFFQASELELQEVSYRSPTSPLKNKRQQSHKKQQILEKQSLSLKMSNFIKKQTDKFWKYEIPVPQSKSSFIWEPNIQVTYKVKSFQDNTLIRIIDRFRSKFSQL